MWLTFNQGTGSSAVMANKDYIVIGVDAIPGQGTPETTTLAAGLTDMCRNLNSQVALPTDSANQNNGPKQITKGVDTRFDNCTTGSPCDISGIGSPLDPATFPPDTNIREGITF